MGLPILLEAVLAKVESGAAPIIDRLCDVGADGLATRPELPLHDRATLALFIATSRLRTPIWREQTRSVFEQFAAFQSQASPESDGANFSITENDLIQQLAAIAGYSGWVLCCSTGRSSVRTAAHSSLVTRPYRCSIQLRSTQAAQQASRHRRMPSSSLRSTPTSAL